MLGKGNIPMVSDFGLARDIYESGAYETTSGVRQIFGVYFFFFEEYVLFVNETMGSLIYYRMAVG